MEEFVAAAPGQLDRGVSCGDGDAVGPFGHCQLLASATSALAGLDVNDTRESDELLLSRVDFDPASLVRPAGTVDDRHDRRSLVGLGLHVSFRRSTALIQTLVWLESRPVTE